MMKCYTLKSYRIKKSIIEFGVKPPANLLRILLIHMYHSIMHNLHSTTSDIDKNRENQEEEV
jgi:hypothetical protein